MSKFVLIAVVLALVAFFFFRSTSNNEATAASVQAGLDFLAENGQREGITTTASGLQYEVMEPGTGTRHPITSDEVTVHYHGRLIDGTVFDSSKDRGEPMSFKLTQVIPGWTEGLQLMVVGETTRFYVPADLAYGRKKIGPIPPGSVLVFDVKLLEINP